MNRSTGGVGRRVLNWAGLAVAAAWALGGPLPGNPAWAQVAPAPPPAASVPAFPYVDQLIEGAPARDEARAQGPAEAQPEGFRATVIEARSYLRRSNGGNLSEGGLYGLHRRETLNHGEWFVEASWRQAADDPLQPALASRSSARVSLRQVGMPLSADWSLGHAFGLFRSAVPDAFVTAFRFSLPSTLLTGAGSYWSSPDTSLQFERGQFTQIEGLQGLGARRLGGHASSAALSHRFDDNWRAGLHVQHVDSSVEAGRFSAWSGALTYTSTLPGVRLRAQALSDSRARRGHWLEGEWRDGLHASRWSLWQFDPGLYWYATLLSSGQRGLAWRHDFSDPARFWGLGVERARNAAFDALRAPTDATYVSGNAGFRIDRHVSVGVIGQWRATVPAYDDGLSQSQRYLSLSAYALRSRSDVSDRLQLSWVSSRGALNSRVAEAVWTREWRLNDDTVWSGSIGVVHEDDDNGSRWRPTAGMTYSTQLANGGSVSGFLRHARDADRFTTTATWTGTLALLWPLSPTWSMVSSLSLNRLSYDTQSPFFSGLPTRLSERSLWVTMRYAEAGGVPYLASLPGDGRGAGSLAGFVFYDDNRDGQRQPSERGAAGVTVWLDNVQSTVTGADGRYEFALVRSGRHALRVDASTVRLPWGLADERAMRVEIEPRRGGFADLPLLRVGE